LRQQPKEVDMLVFEVRDMTCGGCAGRISRALAAEDAGATVEVSVQQRLVRVQPSEADAGELERAIQEAGYTPILLPPEQVPARVAAKAAGACCCGSR
jgi:copper chaperone